jgi:hypothetical protein
MEAIEIENAIKTNSEGEKINRPAETNVSKPGRLPTGKSIHILDKLSTKSSGAPVKEISRSINGRIIDDTLKNVTYELQITKIGTRPPKSKLISFTVHSEIDSTESTDILGICHILKEHYFLQNATFPSEKTIGIEFIKPDNYFDLIAKTMLDFVAYTNYQPNFNPNKPYRYELIDDEKIESILDNFSKNFLKDENKRTDQTPRIEDIQILSDTFDKIFYYKSNDGKHVNLFKIDTSEFGKNEDLIHYNNPALTCLNFIFRRMEKKTIGKNMAKLFYLVLFTKFTIKQGKAIVTSLEHLLYLFLNQIPDDQGIRRYNESVVPDKQFDLTEYRKKTTTSIYKEKSDFTGMIEEVERMYVQGMDNVLGLTGESSDSSKNRFINLIAIKRELGSNSSKRCVGAIDSVDFGQTLTQCNPEFCSENPKFKSSPSGENSNISSLFKSIRSELNSLNSEKLQAFRSKLPNNNTKTGDKKKLLSNLLGEVRLLSPSAVLGESSQAPLRSFSEDEAAAAAAAAEPESEAAAAAAKGGARKLSKKNRKKLNKKGKLSKRNRKHKQKGGDEGEEHLHLHPKIDLR